MQLDIIDTKRAVAALLLAAGAACASASETGPYAFVSGGLASWSADGTSDDTGFGAKSGIGYRFNRNFAAEGGYAFLGSTDINGGGTAKSSGFIVDAVGRFPVAQSIDAVGRVGMYLGNNKATGIESKTKMTVKFGLGAEYKLRPGMTLRGEWEHYSAKYPGETATINLFSAGINVAF